MKFFVLSNDINPKIENSRLLQLKLNRPDKARAAIQHNYSRFPDRNFSGNKGLFFSANVLFTICQILNGFTTVEFEILCIAMDFSATENAKKSRKILVFSCFELTFGINWLFDFFTYWLYWQYSNLY